MRAIVVSMLLLVPSSGFANLLRNGEFQDDWITMLPETKNHHWCFPSEFFNRRDYNPDGWFCKGSWDWQNADGQWGTRRMVITGPAELYQRVNWIAIHDDRQLGGFPDAGGFPLMKPATSGRPERLVRDLTFRVKLSGTNVPANAGVIEVGLHSATGLATHDPMGERNPATAASFVTIPAGSYDAKWLEVKLRAADWLEAARLKVKKGDVELPALASVAIRYSGKTGKLEIERAELIDTPSEAANLLKNGGFETTAKFDPTQHAYPVGWSRPFKYTYFPPRHYYIFNTWHNTNFANRGDVQADPLMLRLGRNSLRMSLPAGDETAVASDAIVLNQKEPRLIEVTAWVKTATLCMLQIDGHDEKGNRLDGFNFIHKAPVSIGTDSWRQVRQVFRPRSPVKEFRLVLAARGVNGYTLDDTSLQPQNAVAGLIWWDDVRVSEPEATAKEHQDRGVKPVVEAPVTQIPHLADVHLGDRRVGYNRVRAVVKNPGPARRLELYFSMYHEGGPVFIAEPQLDAPADGQGVFTIDYPLYERQVGPRQHTAHFILKDVKTNAGYGQSDQFFNYWSAGMKLDLGALYLRPDQKQFVRMNLGISHSSMAGVKAVRLEVVRRGTGHVLKTVEVDATPKAILAQRSKIPAELREDFTNLVVADLDVSFLPVQPFTNPERNWFVRATVIGGPEAMTAESQPFCRLAHDTPQPAIQNVTIKNGMTHINGQPWMPFGVCYGHTPVYDGPADPGPGKYRDLKNLPGWSMYDRHHGNTSNRKQYDFNCMRYVAGSITPFDTLNKRWADDNLYCSSAFAIPTEAMSLDALFKKAGGQAKLDAYLEQCRTSPQVVSIAPGIEEAFGLFQGATPAELKGLELVVEYTRKKSGRPVMVGHGGYWNRLEFEKVPFFDIYDPETEPLYPANIHTDLAPLFALAKGERLNKVIWLRPQMYESIPYERWRFHTYVELMRGARGWQIAHGPGDASLFRGLHGEMEFWKPIVATAPSGAPELGAGGKGVRIDPWIEHKSWKHQGKTYLIAATTRGLPVGRWQWTGDVPTLKPPKIKGKWNRPAGDASRLTQGRSELRDETNAYAIAAKPDTGPAIHGIQYLPDARTWPKGTKLIQWVKVDGKDAPKGLAVLVKGDGRWTHAATWGDVNLASLRDNPANAYWFLNSFYRHAKGFLGWGTDLVGKSMEYIPAKLLRRGDLPAGGIWTKYEVSLDELGAAGKLIDGVGFLHDGGRVWWGRSSLITPDGHEQILLGDGIDLPGERLTRVKIHVEGLKAGTRVRVLFEGREIVAMDDHFEDDFRGHDLYQRHGGGAGYGNAPVALHAYEIP